ncbi:MAG: RNA polymerase sigma factor [Syntrophaceae bacterium]|nr:RNA polymerase sigma factor [Syntrophaceae bacterium]
MDQRQAKDIVQRILEGDTNAYALLVDAYKNPILQLAYRMTGSLQDADDLSQEAFIRAFRNLHRYDRERPFFTWLYTVALNGIRNHLKKKKREEAGSIESACQGDPADNAPGMEDRLDEAREAERLQRMLWRLPADQREALILRFYQGLSLEETSEILGISLSAAKMRIYRGLERLKQLLSRGNP